MTLSWFIHSIYLFSTVTGAKDRAVNNQVLSLYSIGVDRQTTQCVPCQEYPVVWSRQGAEGAGRRCLHGANGKGVGRDMKVKGGQQGLGWIDLWCHGLGLTSLCMTASALHRVMLNIHYLIKSIFSQFAFTLKNIFLKIFRQNIGIKPITFLAIIYVWQIINY